MKLFGAFALFCSLGSFALASTKVDELISECKDIGGRQVQFSFTDSGNQNGYATAAISKDREYIPKVVIDIKFYALQPEISQAFIVEGLCAHHALGHVLSDSAVTPSTVLAADCFAIKALVKKDIVHSVAEVDQIANSLYMMTYGSHREARSASYPGLVERIDNLLQCATHK